MKPAAKLAWQRTIDFFNKNLRGHRDTMAREALERQRPLCQRFCPYKWRFCKPGEAAAGDKMS